MRTNALGTPYVRIGDGPIAVVVVSGGDAFVRRPDARNVAARASRIARLFPRSCTVYVLGYDPAFPTTVEQLVADTAHFIMSHAERAILVGVSFGGLIAMRVAAKHPEAVEGLVLISSAARFSPEGRARVLNQINALEQGNFMAMAKPFARLFRRRRFNILASIALWMRRNSLAIRMNDPSYIVHMLRLAVACSDSSQVYPTGTATLLLLGGRDQFFDTATAKDTLDRVQTGQLVTFAEDTHMLAIESASAVRRAITPFLHGNRAKM